MAALFTCSYGGVMANLLGMTKNLVVFLLIAAVSISPAHGVAAPEPLVLKPSSKWQVDYADERCRLARQFGDGDSAVLLFMDRYGPGEYFRLSVSGKSMKTSVAKGDADVQFGPSEGPQKLAFLNGFLGKAPALVFAGSARMAGPSADELLAIKNRSNSEWIELQPISENRQKAVRYLRIGKPLRKEVVLETGSMRPPLAALDTCIDNLLTTWGVDVEKHKNLTSMVTPLGSPGNWIKSADYPLDMLGAGQPALVNFRLSVGPDGVPTACYIQSTTRPKEFDDAVCKSVMKRARFSPAVDAQGQRIASYYQNAVRFQIP